jgi:hypothetical protein
MLRHRYHHVAGYYAGLPTLWPAFQYARRLPNAHRRPFLAALIARGIAYTRIRALSALLNLSTRPSAS